MLLVEIRLIIENIVISFTANAVHSKDLPSAVKRQNEDGVLRRSRSIPDLREDTSDVPFIKVRNSLVYLLSDEF